VLFAYNLGSFQMSSGVAGYVATFEVDDYRLGGIIKITGISLLLLAAAASIGEGAISAT
jgi:hypothetical protein